MVLVSKRKTEGQLGFRFPHIRRGRTLIYVSVKILYEILDVLKIKQFLKAMLNLNKVIKWENY